MTDKAVSVVVTLQGRPIYIERLGILNIDELFKRTTEERIIKYYVREYERLMRIRYPAASEAAGTLIEQSITILDMQGFSMKMMNSRVKNFIKLASSLGQDYYPEVMYKMFIVNAPMLFSGVWTLVKGFIDKKTAAKISILGSKYQKELFEHVSEFSDFQIDPANLPEFLSGTCKHEPRGWMYADPGPWAGKIEDIDSATADKIKQVFQDSPEKAPLGKDEESKASVAESLNQP